MQIEIELESGKKINKENGRLQQSEANDSCSILIYPVACGATLRIIKERETCSYYIAYYTEQIPDQYIYTYDYEPEQNWSTYSELTDITDCMKKNRSYSFTKTGYIRVWEHCEKNCENDESAMLLLETCEETPIDIRNIKFLDRQDVKEEIERTVKKVTGILEEKKNHNDKLLLLTLMADTHHTINDIWKDTFTTVHEVMQGVGKSQNIKAYDGTVHLGDLADGILSKKYCKYFSGQVMKDIRSLGVPYYLTIGNHDTNYFYNNKEQLSKQEQYEYYIDDIETSGKSKNQLWYYVDYEKAGLRGIFLQSFDAEESIRYGFCEEEITWLEHILEDMQNNYKVVVFSHDAPAARLDYWASEIRNGEKLLGVLEKWHKEHGNRVMAYLHGHTHADYCYTERAFPIMSIGCSKCEFFRDKKPEGSIAFPRIPDEVTQELWDTMLIDTEENTIDFVRFGAGIDRRINQDMMGSKVYETKIWAHRGASAYAPENSMEAFKLAIEMHADGIELDVQFTKDRQLVVIHDETIDRVSNGYGKVVDYSLEELRRFDFNNGFSEYKDIKIPTLKEVLELVKQTNMILNIELKTGVNFYEGIERRVIELVECEGMSDRVIYSSFNHESVIRVKSINSSAKTGFLYCDGIYDVASYAKENQIDAIHPSVNNMQYPQLVEECKEGNIKIHVWTVNSVDDMRRMCELGVDAIITNYPDQAYEVVNHLEGNEKSVRVDEEVKCKDVDNNVNRNILLHLLGITYGRVRTFFVKIDQKVQKAAGK